MWTQILLTALISATVTLAVLGLAYRLWLAPKLEARMDAAADELEDRVRRGAIAAGEELLPAFRAEVRGGFEEAFRNWPSEEFRSVTRTGAGVVEEGLSALFGRRRGEGPDRQR